MWTDQPGHQFPGRRLCLERAEKAGIESMVISRKECGSAENFDKKLVSELKSHGIELVVLAGFLSILGKEVIELIQTASSTFIHL